MHKMASHWVMYFCQVFLERAAHPNTFEIPLGAIFFKDGTPSDVISEGYQIPQGGLVKTTHWASRRFFLECNGDCSNVLDSESGVNTPKANGNAYVSHDK